MLHIWPTNFLKRYQHFHLRQMCILSAVWHGHRAGQSSPLSVLKIADYLCPHLTAQGKPCNQCHRTHKSIVFALVTSCRRADHSQIEKRSALLKTKKKWMHLRVTYWRDKKGIHCPAAATVPSVSAASRLGHSWPAKRSHEKLGLVRASCATRFHQRNWAANSVCGAE